MNNTKRKRYVISVVSVLFLVTVISVTGFAEVPKKINYQGYLVGPDGFPVDGTVAMTFSIYDNATDGNLVWSKPQLVEVEDGRYRVRLEVGEEPNPMNLAEAKPYYLEIWVGSEKMEPREELTSAMYALFVEGVTTGEYSTMVGKEAGANNNGIENTFIGKSAGNLNTTGYGNTFIGHYAGGTNKSGYGNTYIGKSAGSSSTGAVNTFIGRAAGWSNKGSGNVFIGNMAGSNATGSNMLYIDNSNTNTPLIYGEFLNNKLVINGKLHVNDAVRLVPRPSPPSDPSEGDMYMDSTDHKLKVYDGTTWQACW